MNELERLFRLIITNLSAAEPERLRRPLLLADIRDRIAPYRASRRALGLENSEDYELALMRLCAGEGGFARLESDEIGRAFADEIRSPHPDLTLVQRHDKAELILNPRALVEADPHQAYAPPARSEGKGKTPRKGAKPVQDASRPTPSRCKRCRADLPGGRVVNFCPQCGYDQRRAHCSQCNAELEPEWRHCVICGQALSRV